MKAGRSTNWFLVGAGLMVLAGLHFAPRGYEYRNAEIPLARFAPFIGAVAMLVAALVSRWRSGRF